MTGRSPFLRHLLINLRKSLVVIAVVLVGLSIYAALNNEPVEWEVVAVVAIGMMLSSLGNAYFNARREKT